MGALFEIEPIDPFRPGSHGGASGAARRCRGAVDANTRSAGRYASPPAASASPMAGHAVAGKNAQERVEQRIKELHAQLRITAAEQQQWDQFARVMRENARDMDQAYMQRAQQFPAMNAVQNMQSYEQIAEEHTKLLQKLIPAFETLYEAMSDQQKQVAEQVFRANAEQHAQRRRNG
jgi:periplasmic protein CpxP/Spy